MTSRRDGRRRGLRQLVVNANSGSAEGASVEAAKPARTLQRHGRGGDAEVGGTAWCRRQCVVPSWGWRVARVRARASAGEDGREGASASFIDEVRRFARRRKNLCRHCARRPRFMARWVPPYLHDELFNIVSTLAGFQEME